MDSCSIDVPGQKKTYRLSAGLPGSRVVRLARSHSCLHAVPQICTLRRESSFSERNGCCQIFISEMCAIEKWRSCTEGRGNSPIYRGWLCGFEPTLFPVLRTSMHAFCLVQSRKSELCVRCFPCTLQGILHEELVIHFLIL